MIELPAQRHDAGGRNLTPLGLQATIAGGGGDEDRTTGVGFPMVPTTSRWRRRLPNRRWIHPATVTDRAWLRAAPKPNLRWSCEGEFVQVRLREQRYPLRASAGQAASLVAIWSCGPASRSCRVPFAVDQILQDQRNAVQRPELPAAGNLLGRRARACQRIIRSDVMTRSTSGSGRDRGETVR